MTCVGGAEGSGRQAGAVLEHADSALPASRPGQEVQLDKIAERLQMDPAALRLGIVAPPDTLTANYPRIGTIGLADCIRKVVDRSGWNEKFRTLPLGRGLGLACSSRVSGASMPINCNDVPRSGVPLKLDRSGGVTAVCGATEIGQRSDDLLVAMVAEVLGIEPFDVRAVTGDPDLTPVDLGSYSSRVTLMMGDAAIQAAERARGILAAAVSAKMEIPVGRLVFTDRRVFDGQNPETGVPFQEAVCIAEARVGTIGTTRSSTPPKSAAWFKGGGPSPTYSCTAVVVEGAVDPENGWVTVPRVWIAHDIGCTLNPTLVRGQVEGKPARSGPASFPDIAWPETWHVRPPWEGGDGRASNEPERRTRRKADAGVEATAGSPTAGLTIGAGVTLSQMLSDPRVRQSSPGLYQAASQIATPHLRNMGTLGGNFCLDTRCTYYDQNYEWRKSIDFCLKKDGDTCWVAEFFANDGMSYLTKQPGEIVTAVALPDAEGWHTAYWKLRRRGAFDFPVAAAAVAARLDGRRVDEVRIVLGAVSSRPLAAAELATPMDNTDVELVWRKKMVRSLVIYALQEIRGDDMRERRLRIARQIL